MSYEADGGRPHEYPQVANGSYRGQRLSTGHVRLVDRSPKQNWDNVRDTSSNQHVSQQCAAEVLRQDHCESSDPYHRTELQEIFVPEFCACPIAC
ncbi:hypothetical protein D3C72_2064560 [compost metagenome]